MKARFRSAPALLLLASLVVAPRVRADEPRAAPATPPSPADPSAAGAPPAAPAPTMSCSEAYELAQTEKVAGHYVTAAAASLQCSQLECSAAIVRECMRFYEALQADMPTLVFSARKAEGGELVDVRVEIDGKPTTEQITGRPLAVDPGAHEFVFIHRERGRMVVKETARVGDHARVIEVTFADPNPAPVALAPLALAPLPPPADPPPRRSHAVPVMTYVLGGVGVVALGSFVFFRVQGVSDYNQQNSTCSPRCNPSDVDPIRTKFMLSYISLGVGAAAVTGAGLIYFLAPGRDGSHAVQASIAPVPGGANVGLGTKF